MDKMKYMAENINNMLIGVDDTFKFHCTQCGKCCINRDDILLNPKDLYKISRELNITINELIKRYCDVYIGINSLIPIVRIKPQGNIKRCPFLKDRKCSVHNSKPTVCAMFPIGRCIKIEKGEKVKKSDIQYLYTNPNCDKSETHTLREWFDRFGINLEDEYFIKWNQTLMDLSQFLHDIEKTVIKEDMLKLQEIIFRGLYLVYNKDKDFYKQFEENVFMLTELIKLFSGYLKGEINLE